MRLLKRICTFSIALGAISIVGCAGSKKESSNSNAASAGGGTIIDVRTVAAEQRDVPMYFESTGTLFGDAQTNVAPAVGGKIVEVNFDIGSLVRQGDVLIRLDPRDSQIRLDQAQKTFEQTKASYNQAQVRLGLTAEGQTFNIETFSQVRSSKAQLELAEKELARAVKLLESGDIPRSVFDQRKAQRDSLLAQLDEARANAAVAVKAIDAARGAMMAAEAQVSAAKKSLSDMSVLSPISGYISERTANVGEFISPNVPNSKIATIVKTSVLRMKIDVPEESIGKVSKGQSVSVQVTAYPDRNFAGRVVRIAPSVNPTSRTMIVEAEIENGDGLLKPGQFATVRVTQSKPVPTVMVPVSAVRTDGTVSRIYVIRDGVASERLVQTGLLEGDMIEIKKGIAADEVVATSNIDALADGFLVRTIK